MVTQVNLGNLGLNLRSPRDFQRGGSGRDISILLVSRCIVGTLRYVGGAYRIDRGFGNLLADGATWIVLISMVLD